MTRRLLSISIKSLGGTLSSCNIHIISMHYTWSTELGNKASSDFLQRFPILGNREVSTKRKSTMILKNLEILFKDVVTKNTYWFFEEKYTLNPKRWNGIWFINFLTFFLSICGHRTKGFQNISNLILWTGAKVLWYSR